MRYKFNEGKNQYVDKKKPNIQNVTMTYEKIKYSFDILMRIRMLEVICRLILRVYIYKHVIPNKPPQTPVYYMQSFKKIFVEHIQTQTQTLCLYVLDDYVVFEKNRSFSRKGIKH